MGLENGKSEKLSRRLFINGGIATAALVAGGVVIKNRHDSDPQDESFLNVEKRSKQYEMGRLARVKFSDLLSAYTGIEGMVNSHEQIDFRYQLAELWKRKLAYVKTGRHPEAYPGVYAAAKASFSSYRPEAVTRLTLSQYRDRAQKAIEEVRRDLHATSVTKLEAFKSLTKAQAGLLGVLERSITGDGLMAFALTEIMPTKGASSTVGVDTFDFLLRNAGVEFVDRIPALHDSRVSSGAYQFTSDALLDSGTTRNGASLIQRVLHRPHIPANIAQLQGDMQHKAAYLYAVYNLAVLVRKLGDTRSSELLAHGGQLPKHIVTEYVASAHHLPANALHAFDAFSREFIRFEKTPVKQRGHGSRPPDFSKHCEATGVGEYCRKTQSNIQALKTRM